MNKPRTFTVVIEVEMEPTDAMKKTRVPSSVAVGKRIQEYIPLGEDMKWAFYHLKGWKLKGSRVLATGSRTGYISGVGK